MAAAGAAGAVLGVAFLAAFFYSLRRHRLNFETLGGRLEELEYGCMREAYRQQGYDV
jgi:hypothetical protein